MSVRNLVLLVSFTVLCACGRNAGSDAVPMIPQSGQSVIAPAQESGRTLLATTGQQNALQNSDFEQGSLGAWSQIGNPFASNVVTTVALSPTHSVLLGSTNPPEVSGFVGIKQPLTIPSAATLKYSLQGSVNNVGEAADVEVDLVDANNKIVLQCLKGGISSTSWTTKTCNLASLSGQTLFVVLGVTGTGSSSNKAYAYFDDVQVSGGPLTAPSPTGTGLISATADITAAAGGSMTLSDGSSIYFPPNSIPADSKATVSLSPNAGPQPQTEGFVSFGGSVYFSLSPLTKTMSQTESSAAVATPSPKASTPPVCGPAYDGIQMTMNTPSSMASTLAQGYNWSFSKIYSPGAAFDLEMAHPIETLGMPAPICMPVMLKNAVQMVVSIAKAMDQYTKGDTGLFAFGNHGSAGVGWGPAATLTSPLSSCQHPILLLHGILSNVEDTWSPLLIQDYLKLNGTYDCVLGYNYNWTDLPDNIATQMASDINTALGPRTILDIAAHSYGTIVAMDLIPRLTNVKEVQNLVLVAGPLNGAVSATSESQILAEVAFPAGVTYSAWYASVLKDHLTSLPGVQNWVSTFKAGNASGIEFAMLRSPNAPENVVEVAGLTPYPAAQSLYNHFHLTPGPNDGIILQTSAQDETLVYGQTQRSNSRMDGLTTLVNGPGDNHTALLPDTSIMTGMTAELRYSYDSNDFGSGGSICSGSCVFTLKGPRVRVFVAPYKSPTVSGNAALVASLPPDVTANGTSVSPLASGTKPNASNALTLSQVKFQNTSAFEQVQVQFSAEDMHGNTVFLSPTDMVTFYAPDPLCVSNPMFPGCPK